MKNKKLIRQIEKYYFSHNQTLILDTWEKMQNNDNDCSFDVHLADSDIELFTVQNYNNFWDLDVYFANYLKSPPCKIVERWDGVKASYLPLYYDGIITLKKFEPITKQDIINCATYFTRHILGEWFFNIKINDKEKSNG